MQTKITKVQLSLIITIVFVVCNIAFGQQWVGSSDTTGTIHRDGYVGIGTSNPTSPLEVNTTSQIGIAVINETSPARLQLQSYGRPSILAIARKGGTLESPSSTQPDDALGIIWFNGSGDAGEGRVSTVIRSYVDTVTSTGPLPGRIEFACGTVASGLQTHMTIKSSGNIGIGTVTPDALLHVQQTSAASQVHIESVTSGTASLKITDASGGAILLRGDSGDSYINSGNVGIGTSSPQSLLAVNGEITAKEVTVTSTGWPDFVFEEDYPLMKIQEVKEYIQNNHRLPAIPAASEVEKEGVNLGELLTKLLQKTEEMMLYIIQLQNDMENQRKEYQKEIKRLEMQIAQTN